MLGERCHSQATRPVCPLFHIAKSKSANRETLHLDENLDPIAFGKSRPGDSGDVHSNGEKVAVIMRRMDHSIITSILPIIVIKMNEGEIKFGMLMYVR